MNTPTPNDGGPAFPRPSVEITDDERAFGQVGMTLRDWLAGQAMVGIVLSPLGQGGRPTYESTARDAYRYADAMIAERNKE